MERGGLYPRGAYRARGAGGLRPQGAQRRREDTPPPALSGETSTVAAYPYPRAPIKPQLLLTNPASASAPNTEPHAELHQPSAT